MKWIFISHPLTGNEEENKAKEREICKEILESKQGLPISPLALFNFIDKESQDLREMIMAVCKRMIDICDEVWIYGDSPGCREERQYAKKQGKIIKEKGTRL